ncbi:MAG: hypothetical protein VCB26_05470 [Candidatus Hydrogenedentota bacterium]
MNVHGVGAGIPPNRNIGRGAGADSGQVQPPVAESTPSESGKTRGVIRLLQEGHFKGVVDVRLRINFHDEISQLGSQAVGEEFSEASEPFFAGVDEGFENLLTAISATVDQTTSATDLFDSFKTSINGLADAFLNGGGADFGSVASQIQTDFDSFIVQLQVELDLQVDDSFLDDFRSAFTQRLGQLADSVSSTANVLPEISAASENGVAYAKFMEILNGLNAPAPDAQAEPPLPEVLA